MAFELNFETAPYGRRSETNEILHRFSARKNLLMAGPRRLGKTFVFERLEERATGAGWHVFRMDVSSCKDSQEFMVHLCETIAQKQGVGKQVLDQLKQRLQQVVQPKSASSGQWYQFAIQLDWRSFADELIERFAARQEPVVLLVDELPVLLLNLHGRPGGLSEAKELAYKLRALREEHPSVRWMFTGSIGIEPLAREGEYLGAFNNLEPFPLEPLDEAASIRLIQDWAAADLLHNRKTISTEEARAICEAVGWRSAFYLEAMARCLDGLVSTDPGAVALAIERARKRLLRPDQRIQFESWPEHLRKNFHSPAREQHFKVMEVVCEYPGGLSIDALLGLLSDGNLSRNELRRLLNTLEEHGFLLREEPEISGESPSVKPTWRFRIELVRLWWQLYLPSSGE